MVISPRPVTQVLSDAMNSFAGIWRALLFPALTVSVPMSVVTILVFRLTGGADFLELVVNSPEAVQALPPEVFIEVAKPFYIALGIASLLQLLTAVFVALVSHRAVAANLSGSPARAVVVARQALHVYPRGVGAALLIVLSVAVLIGLGIVIWLVPILSVGTPNQASEFVAFTLLLILLGPGVWVGVSVSMATSAMAIEGIGALAAIRRSMRLVRGRWWPTAGFITLVGLIGGIAIQLIQVVALPLAAVGGGSPVLTIVSALGLLTQGVLVAGIAAIYTHWYVDLRARRETLATSDLA